MQYHCSRCHYVLEAPAGKDGDGGELQCPRCKAEKMPHVACPTCGAYNGRQYAEALRTEHEPS